MHDDFGSKLKTWRVQHGWNQKALAAHLGVTQATVSRWERQIDTPAPRNLLEIRGILDRWSLQNVLEIERIGIAGLMTPRAIFDTDGLKLLAWSNGFAELWPKNHQGKTLEFLKDRYLVDELANETAQIIHDPETEYQIGKGNIIAISCVTQKSTEFEDDHPFAYRMHGTVRLLGSRRVIDLIYESVPLDMSPRVEPVLFRP